MKEQEELELYLHIPFCVQKCAYCDFLSAPANPDRIQKYVDTLKTEIRHRGTAFSGKTVRTVFMGGGTPSILTSVQINEIFRELRESFAISEQAEISIEANPGTVTEEKLLAWREAGIDRLSIGLQSVNESELQMLGRIHTWQQFLDTYQMARSAGFANINIDLISAIPGQTVQSWEQTLRTAAELDPEHISAYSLIVEEGTPFYDLYGEGGESENLLPDEDTERKIYEITKQILEEYGFRRYEISNYAKPGYECRHNIGYWRRVPYLGLGLGASSFMGGQRFHNPREESVYEKSVRCGKSGREDAEILSAEDEMAEFFFLGLRLMDGVEKSRFLDLFGKTVEEVYAEPLQKLKKQGLLEEKQDILCLTERGIDVSNYVFAAFLL